MISVALIADSGLALEAMTRSLASVPGVDIVRHYHGGSPVTRAMSRCAPDLVLIDEMRWPKLALRRIAEVRISVPKARIVVRVGRPDAAWLADALRAGACAVVPETAGTETLAVVLQEVVVPRISPIHEQQDAIAA
jgi:DNA-binding NarL/FixJ family response regulator